MFDMMAKVAASFIIGPEFATDNDFIQQALSYMFQINATTAAIYSYPRIVRPLAWQFAPACRALRSAIISLKKRLIPEIRARVIRARSGEKDGKFSMLDVLIETAIEQNVLRRDGWCKEEERAVDQLAQHTMFFFFDAAAPIASVATIMLYRIMTSPEYAPLLREETSKALKASGGEWSSEILSSMPRLESYTREVLRIHVPLVWGPSRQVLKPLTINSLKLILRPGDLITVPALFTHTDPDLYPDAMEFDPNRFYDSASEKCVPRVTTTTDTFLSFGHGTCACPGRTLAMKAVQILFAKMLLLYEVEFADGRKDFPANVLTPGFNLQDPTVMMRVKWRVSSGPANTVML
ncbi:cytochrome P450 [Aspergillus chevalieri]|uniref:Cytochrome P450 n=1 Tax=Aspergillus chevalieri TaxID=182096 RepID=A0A7R7VVM5_ASPCH|nr:uncharacterized protein ACHE_60929A [Aspergillus chevalieri]BCR91043.1 hypothetical protein ACHE_60929A [Aspergillus chevalieri]